MRIGATSTALRALLSSAAIVLPIAFSSPALAEAQDGASGTKPRANTQLAPGTTEQPRPREVTDQKPIVITGSRIPRTDLTAVSPVIMVKSEEIQLEGATNVEEVLNRLPQVNPSQGEFVSNGATGAATVDLRGLGSVRTLVLVNGHRLMPGDPRDPVADINSIPASVIQRVEVLTGGAAAAYGSDAVAGVVNFILDTKLNGLKVDGQLSEFQHNNRDTFVRGFLDARHIAYPRGSVLDGRRLNMIVAFGHSFFDDRAHVTLYGGYREITELRQDSRDYSACAVAARIVDHRPTSTLICGGSFASYPGNFFDNLDNVYQVTRDRTFEPGFVPFNYGPWNFYQRPDKRYTGGGFADFEIGSGLKPYAEVMYMNDRSVAQVAPSGNFANTETINCDNPLLSDQQRSLICRTSNFVGEIPVFDDDGNLVEIRGSPQPFIDPVTGAIYYRGWLAIGRRNVEGGPRQDDLRHKSIRLLGGFEGNLGRGVTYDTSYLWGQVNLDRQYRNDVSVTRLSRAIDVVTDPSTGQPVCRSVLIARELGPSAPDADADCVPWDVFTIGAVTPESTAYLDIPSFMRGWFKEQIGNANATIQLDKWGIQSPWAEESPAINIGAETRKDTVDYEPDEFAQNGDLAGFGFPEAPIRGSINIKEVFGEARIPVITDKLVRRLAFEGGYRKSWYSNGGAKFSTNAYKLALDLTAVTGLRLRASQQRANRAPNVQELFAPVDAGGFDRDPCAGFTPHATEAQCALTGVTPAQYGHIISVNNTLFSYNSIVGGNVNLQPETATTRTIGLVLEPRFLRGFNATLDWWNIKLDGAIAQIDAQTIIDTCVASGDPIFCSRIHRDLNGSLWLTNGYVDARNLNIGGFQIHGIDVGTDYSARLGRFGSANFQFRGSYVLKWIVDNGGLSTPYDCAGLFGDPCGIRPRWRHSARATWNAPIGVSLSLDWRHIGGTKLAALNPLFNQTEFVSAADTELHSQNYFDLTTVFRVQKRYEIRLGVNNVLDRQPPRIIGNTPAVGAFPNGNTNSEWYDALGRYIFAAVAINLKPF